MIPDLEPHCGSWVIVSRATGGPVLETYSRAVAERISLERYEVLTAAQWLARVNRMVPGGDVVTAEEKRRRLGR